MKYVKFTGKFRDLIPAGFHFWKAYARNYRVYQKSVDGKEYGPCLRIWQHLGGYMEIEDLFSLSALVVEAVQTGAYKDFLITEGLCAGNYHSFINRTGRYIEKRDRLKHREPYWVKDWETIPKEEQDQRMAYYYNTWQHFYFGQEMVDAIQDLLNKGWIEIVDNDKVYRK